MIGSGAVAVAGVVAAGERAGCGGGVGVVVAVKVSKEAEEDEATAAGAGAVASTVVGLLGCRSSVDNAMNASTVPDVSCVAS